MKILVTGASGFIGRYLSSYAAAQGHDVTGTYLAAPELSSRIDTDRTIRWVRLDIQDAEAVRKLVASEKPDAVFHLAAQAYAKKAWADPIDTFRTNVLGTIALYEALRVSPPKNGVLLTASAAAYGIPPSLPVREETPLWATNPYGVSKAAQETISYQYFLNFGLRIVRARLFGTTGPGKTGDALNDFARQVARLERGGVAATLKVGNLEPKRDISDIRDSVRALWKIFESGDPAQPVNVGAGRSYSVRWIVDQLVGLARVPLTVETDPALLRPTDELDNASDTSRLESLGHVRQYPLERTIRDALEFWRGEPEPAAAPKRTGGRRTGRTGAARRSSRPGGSRHRR
jgi:GDP-4-dehydro-6-deoxy-D-mannose reductase